MNRLESCLCPNCGKEQPAAATSCSFCGAPLCFGDTERSRRIRQLLDGEDAVPAPPVASFVPNAPQPEPVPTEEPEPAPDAAPPKGVRQWIRRHIRLTIAIGVAAVALIALVAIPLRNTLLGYHASPQALVEGLNIAVEQNDREALSDLFWTEEGTAFRAELYTGWGGLSEYQRPLIYVSQVHDFGSPYAVMTVYYGELDTSQTESFVDSPEITAERYCSAYLFTVAAIKQDGRWYFSSGDYDNLMRASFY